MLGLLGGESGRIALFLLCCQVQKLKKSRRIASFLTLLGSKNKEVSQNCFVLTLLSSKMKEVSQNSLVFKLADRQVDRQTR